MELLKVVLLALAASLVLIGYSFADSSFTTSLTAAATFQAPSNCIISTSGLSFNNVQLGTTAQSSISIQNTGNIAANSVLLSGNEWSINDANLSASSIGWTTWSDTQSGTYTPLTNASVDVGLDNFQSGATQTLWFNLNLPNNAPIGNALQTITLVSTC